jgi:hypothetical protein
LVGSFDEDAVLDLRAGSDDLRERQRILIPEIARAITKRWISEVPSKMV